MELAEIANKFQDLIEDGTMTFRTYTDEELGEINPWVLYVAKCFLIEHRFKFEVGSEVIDGCYCFRVEDEYLQYLDVFPQFQKYQWATDEHSKGIPPEAAMHHLIKREYPDMNINAQPDGSLKIGNIIIQHKQ
jgi:hypothetical protein